MIKLANNLYIGDEEEIYTISLGWKIVSCCKTQHQKILDYKGSLPSNHEYYKWYENNYRLVLNLVDLPYFDKNYQKHHEEMINHTLDYIERNIKINNIFIHCNQGESRSPSIAMLYMYKNKLIDGDTFEELEDNFRKIYKKYNPKENIRENVKIIYNKLKEN